MIDDTNDRQPEPEAPADTETDFEAAFAERASQGDEPGGTASEPQPEGEGEQPKPEEDPKGANEAPPPAPAPAPAPAEGTSVSPAPAADPWDGLTPDQRARLARLQTSERSQRGRVGALTKKVQRLEGGAAAPAPAGKPPQPEEQQPPPEGGDAPAGESSAEKLARLETAARDYPESIGPAKEIIDELRQEIAALKPQLEKVSTDADAAEVAAAYDALAEAHSDYAELAADKDFLGWAGDQTEQVRALLNSWNPRDVSLVLTLYKAEKAAAAPNVAEPEPAPAGDGKGESETDAKRRRQLEASRATPSRGAPAAAGVADDFDAAFTARMKQHEKDDQP